MADELSKIQLPNEVEYDIKDATARSALQNKANNTQTFSMASSRENIASGETVPTLFGKIQKWFNDLDVDSLEDNGVYLYRQSLANGTRALEEIVGGSVGWNQKFDFNADLSVSGLTITKPKTGTYRFNGTLSSGTTQHINQDFVGNHVYYLRSGRNQADIVLSNNATGSTSKAEYIFKPSNTWHPILYVAAGTYTNADFVPQVFDLTAAFNTAIADYAYSLETATAGSGISWLKSQGFFTEPYYAYDLGSVQSVRVDRKEVAGKNLCKYWKNAYINGSHDIVNNNDNVMCYPVRMIAGKSYTISKGTTGTYGYCVYADKDFTETITYNGTVGNPTTLSYTTDCYLIAWFNVGGGSGSQTSFDEKKPQIEIGSTATDYEPYKKTTITYDHLITLRGIPKLVNNSIQYDGDVYRSDGGGSVRYAEVDLGSLNWNYTNSRFVSDVISDAKFPQSNFYEANIMCAIYVNTMASNTESTDYNKYIALNRYGNVCVRDSAYTDAATFKTAMNGVKLVYELATPTTLSATPFTNPQKTAVGGTEEFVDYLYEQGTRDVAVPVGHSTKYKKLPAEWDDDYMLWLQSRAENSLQDGWHDSFANLTDTSFSNLANGQIPKWNGTSGKWENTADIEGYKTVTGKYITITDGAELPAKDYSLTLSPVQDLNGYDSPWVGGGHYNKWDEEWEVGAYTPAGGKYSNNDRIRCKNPIEVSPNTQYFLCCNASGTIYIFYMFYDENMTPLADTFAQENANRAVTSPQTAKYLLFYTSATYGTTYNNDIAINYPSSITTYSPYSNICPIHGADELGVRVCGKNFWNIDTYFGKADGSGTYTYANDTLTLTGKYYFQFNVKVKKNTLYTLSFTMVSSTVFSTPYILIYTVDSNGNIVNNIPAESGSTDSKKIINTGENEVVALLLYAGNNTSGTSVYKDIQFEQGSTATSYEPYNGHSTTIILPSTVYGGNVEQGGSGSKTYQYIEFDGSNDEAWDIYQADGINQLYITTADLKGYTLNLYANEFKTIGISDRTGNYGTIYASSTAICVNIANIASVADFRTWLSNNNLQVAYELVTSTDISVTPFPQTLLEGVNNVWAEMKENSVVIDNAQQSLSYQPENIVGELRVEIASKANSDDLGDLAYINEDGDSSTKFLRGDGTWQSVGEGLKTVTGNPITLTDASETYAAALSVDLEPIQDLHGYEYPWAAGAGKNKFDQDTVYSNYAQTDGSFRLTGINADGIKNNVPAALVGQQLTFSCYADLSKETSPTRAYVVAMVNGTAVYGTAIEHDTKGVCSVTFTPTSTSDQFWISYGSNGQNYFTLKNVQLELGSTATSYFPYSNICSINGTDEVGVRVCGKNLFDKTDETLLKEGFLNTETFQANSSTRSIVLPCFGNTTYTVSKTLTTRFAIAYSTTEVTFGSPIYGYVGNASATSLTITTGSDAKYLIAYFYNSSSDTKNLQEILDSMQIELGLTATEYEAFNGHSTTIILPSTVYGGSVKQGGSGTETIGYAEFDGSSDEAWTLQSINSYGIANFYIAVLNMAVQATDFAITNYLKRQNTLISQTTDMGFLLSSSGQATSGVLYVRLDQSLASTAEELKTYLASNTLQLCYTEITPTSFSFTPQVLRLLKQYNYITTNGTTITLGYQPDNSIGDAVKASEEYTDRRMGALGDLAYIDKDGDNSTKFLRGDGTWQNASGGASSLSQLSDVNLSSPADGQILKFDNATSKWVNAAEYSYTLPTASASTKGGIKVGDNLSMNGEVLSAKTVPWTKIWNYRSGASFVWPSDKSEMLLVIASCNSNTGKASAGVESQVFPITDPLAYTQQMSITYTSSSGSETGIVYTNMQPVFFTSSTGTWDFEIWVR